MERPEYEQWKSREVARLLALVETERRYWQEIVATLPVSLAILNQSRYVVSANRSFRGSYGVKKQDLRTRRIEDIFPGHAALYALIEDVLSDGPVVEPRSTLIQHAGHQLRATVLPHRDWDEDTSVCALLAVEDLTGGAPADTGSSESDGMTPVAASAQATDAAPQSQESEPQPAGTHLAGTQEESAPGTPAADPAQSAPHPEPPPAEPRQQAAEPDAPASPMAAQVVSPLPVNVPGVFWTLDRATLRFTSLSESATRIVNLAEGVAAGEWPWIDRIAEVDRDVIAEHYTHILKRAPVDGVYSCEFRLAAAPGRWFRETVRVEPHVLHGVLTDVTERRTLESHYVQSQRVDALAFVAGRIAHDLNNPAMIIGGYGEELLESFAESDPRRGDIKQILEATDRITDLTASLQAFSRKPAPDELGSIDLQQELASVVERMRQVGEDLTVEYSPLTAPLFVKAEARGLHSLLFELAAVLSETSKVHVAIRARPSAIRDASYQRTGNLARSTGAVILVENRGPVASTQRRSPLFESPFPGKDVEVSDGNLLARAFRQVESWGGSLWVSPDHRTVRLLLRGEDPPGVEEEPVPAQQAAASGENAASSHEPAAARPAAENKPGPEPVVVAAEPAPSAAPPPPPPPPMPLKRILVVDDEAGIRSLMTKILLREGYDVLDAPDGPEALKVVRQMPIDLLLTDVIMPGMHGRELAEHVLLLRPEVRVLYVSGFTDETAVETGNYPPGSLLLQKPFTLGSLLKKVKEVLGEN